MEISDQEYICPICIQYCIQPVETQCCRHLFCNQCFQKTSINRCVYCRSKQFKTKVRKDVQKIIYELIVPCENEGCKMEMKKGEIRNHIELECDFMKIQCSFCEEKTILKLNYIDHIAAKHKDELQTFLTDSLLQIKLKQQKLNVKLNKNVSLKFDPLQQIFNKNGILAKRGNNNRYYCGAQLDKAGCKCYGYCNPSNDCNCCACMELTLEKNRVLSKNCLINRQGSLCKVVNNIPFCGVRLSANSTLYCGFEQRCPNCRSLQQHDIKKYKRLYE